MPPIDVNLYTSGSDLDWSTLLVALASFVGVLVASWLTGRSTRKAAERSAQALLDVENARTEADQRRHLRQLVADVCGVAMRRVDLYNEVEHEDGRDDVVAALRQGMHEFTTAATLVVLSATDQRIVDAVKTLTDAESEARWIATESELDVVALQDARQALAAAAGALAGTASGLLAAQTRRPT